MALIIIVPVLIVALLASAFVFYILRRDKVKTAAVNHKHLEYLKRKETASHGTAVVIRADGGAPADGATQARVALTLEVTPPGGNTYRAHTGWLVGLMALSYLYEGAKIAVRIDAQDAKIIYPAEEWAKYIPS